MIKQSLCRNAEYTFSKQILWRRQYDDIVIRQINCRSPLMNPARTIEKILVALTKAREEVPMGHIVLKGSLEYLNNTKSKLATNNTPYIQTHQ